jgi:hypothetical protein
MSIQFRARILTLDRGAAFTPLQRENETDVNASQVPRSAVNAALTSNNPASFFPEKATAFSNFQ